MPRERKPRKDEQRKDEQISELVRSLVQQELAEFKKTVTPATPPTTPDENSEDISFEVNEAPAETRTEAPAETRTEAPAETPVETPANGTETPAESVVTSTEDAEELAMGAPIKIMLFRPDLKMAAYFMVVVSIFVGLFYLSDRIFAIDVVTAILHNRVMGGFLLILSMANTLILYQAM